MNTHNLNTRNHLMITPGGSIYALKGYAMERVCMEKDAMQREAMEKDAMQREGMEKDAMQRECMEKDAMQREAMEKDAMERVCMEKDAMQRECMETDAMQIRLADKQLLHHPVGGVAFRSGRSGQGRAGPRNKPCGEKRRLYYIP